MFLIKYSGGPLLPVSQINFRNCWFNYLSSPPSPPIRRRKKSLPNCLKRNGTTEKSIWYRGYSYHQYIVVSHPQHHNQVDPADRKNARADTPAPEAAAWLADPTSPANKSSRQTCGTSRWLTDQPEWTGPQPGEASTEEDTGK